MKDSSNIVDNDEMLRFLKSYVKDEIREQIRIEYERYFRNRYSYYDEG